MPKDQNPHEAFDDDQTEHAVDDIVAHESDEILAIEDEKRGQVDTPKKTSFWQRFKRFCQDWWSDPKKRWGTIGGLALVILVIGIIPPTRYFALNSVGIRASLSIEVLDRSTLQPLKNVKVSLRGESIKTNKEGKAKFTRIKLGQTDLKIERYAFAPVSQKLTVGWGSNPLGEFKLKPTGAQYSFHVSDYLSGNNLAKIEAVSGKASAFSDEDGKLVLTIDEPQDELPVTITSSGYRTEQFTIPADTEGVRPIKMAPGRQHAFISRRSGTLDLYKIYADGQGEEVALKGTGSERDDIAIVPHPTKNVVAVTSARGNKRNSDGFLMSTLTLVDLTTNKAEEVATSERIQIVGWVKNRIVYVRVAAGASGNNPQRHRLISYDSETKDVRELAASNSFSDVMLAAGKIYYAPSGVYQPAGAASFFKIEADGSNKQTLLSQEAWNLFRLNYDTIAVAASGGDWYDYQLGDTKASKLNGEPNNLVSRVYVDGPDGESSLWVDKRDGKGVILTYNIKTNKDKLLHTQSGLTNPISWLSGKAVVYRINTDQETADYALSLDGGDPKKIRDVTNTSGIDQWYYY